MHPKYIATFVAVLVTSFVSAAQTDTAVPKLTKAFLTKYCLDCHADTDGEGGFDLGTLQGDLTNSANLDHWVRTFDRVHDGEMPPQDAGEVDQKELESFLDQTRSWITTAQRKQDTARGRVPSRRLTNKQLERTLQDLLVVDIPLASLMPTEQRTDGFTNIAEAQSISHFQLQSHLSVVDAALDAAFDRALASERVYKKSFTAREIARKNPKRRCRDPEMINGKAVTWSSTLVFYGRITSSTVPRDGWYRIKVTATAVNKPKEHGVWCSVRSGFCNSGAPLMNWIGSFEAMNEAKELTYTAWIPKGNMIEIRPADETLKQARFQGGQVGAGEGGPQNVPGVAMQKMSIEQVHPAGDLQRLRERLFGELPLTKSLNKKTKLTSVSIAKTVTRKQLANQFKSFATIALRRQIADDVLAPYIDMMSDVLDSDGGTAESALRAAYRAILCSPRFLYFVEEPGRLDDYAVASRLSYFLTGSMPDAELFELAAAGKLRDRSTLIAQVDRLFREGGDTQFVEDFTDQWLDLCDIDFTEPDRKLHQNFDTVVQNAMLAETRRYVLTMLRDNKNVSQLIDSRYTYLNSRLARYYGIDGVEGDKLRWVRLDDDSPRGGLLGQGAVLKVTANGTSTSPVVRGVWMCDRLLGDRIPDPPSNVPAIEPDVRGAKTIREMLEKHRDHVECAGCHAKIDPPGFALENFDAAGRWRDYYFISGKRKKGPKVNSSYQLASGEEFKDFVDFQKLVSKRTRPIARNLAEKLMVYATGEPISFADRNASEKIAEAVAKEKYGMRSILNAVVTSPVFLTK